MRNTIKWWNLQSNLKKSRWNVVFAYFLSTRKKRNPSQYYPVERTASVYSASNSFKRRIIGVPMTSKKLQVPPLISPFYKSSKQCRSKSHISVKTLGTVKPIWTFLRSITVLTVKCVSVINAHVHGVVKIMSIWSLIWLLRNSSRSLNIFLSKLRNRKVNFKKILKPLKANVGKQKSFNRRLPKK